MSIFETDIDFFKSDILPVYLIFKLYDTYGFPVDLTADIAREKNLKMDMQGFDIAMEAQKKAARSASNFEYRSGDLKDLCAASEFIGYHKLEDDVLVTKLYKEGAAVESLSAGEAGILVSQSTPFYGESGGQVGDQGLLSNKNSELQVLSCTKQDGVILHHVEVKRGLVEIKDSLRAVVNKVERSQIAIHHSATHLMHAALKQVLGEHVNQKGSLVDAEKLRFDFSHYEAVTVEELKKIETLVNQQILLNSEVITEEMDIESAKKKGAMALFGEKYDSKVRVLTMGENNVSMQACSMELCGGTHVQRTGDFGIFVIVSEGAVASGVRRIEALSGEAAFTYISEQNAQLSAVASLLKTDSKNAEQAVKTLIEKTRLQDKELEKLKSKLAASEGDTLLDAAQEVAGVQVLAAIIDADPKSLREVLDQVKNKLGSGVVALAIERNGKSNLIAGVTKDLTDTYKAGELVNYLAQQLGGKGGGRPDMAQAGAGTSEGLAQVMASVADWVKSKS